jgi:rhamnose utilization protein RhaD (predicted bifunctional aldolase and dehydrogenase)
MSDEEMVAYLAHCMVEPGSRRPSIETLLHAFLPARHVDHVHADVICALTNNAEPERHVRAALGDDIAVVPYIRPGFALSKQVGELANARAVVLAKHGLVTWGDTDEASYGMTLELVARAQAYLEARLTQRESPAQPDLSPADRRALLVALRGRLSRDRRSILALDRSQRQLADRHDVETVATAARATPDHILRIGARSAVIRSAADVAPVVDAFADDYTAYFARHGDRLPEGLGMLSPLPRVILTPGLGAIAAGPDAKTARVNAEIAYRSHRVTAMTTDAFGEIDWLSEEDIFDFDYWPLELFKLAAAPPPKPLAGHIAVVLDAGTPTMDSIATRLAADGAHLVLAGSDSDVSAASAKAFPAGTAVAATSDTALTEAVESFGGVDLVVTGESVSREVLAEMAAILDPQGIGGALVQVSAEPDPERLRAAAPFGRDARVNGVQIAAGSVPERAAEAVAFLVSPRAAGIDGVVLPVA